MSIISWDNTYSVDIQEIDEQHKCLVEIMNELYIALANRSDTQLIGHVLDKLVDYTRIHFAVEETLMRLFNYSEYDQHKATHDMIVEQVEDFQRKFHTGNNHVGMELLMFLRDWLFDHINKADKQYTKTFHKGGVQKNWLRKFW